MQDKHRYRVRIVLDVKANDVNIDITASTPEEAQRLAENYFNTRLKHSPFSYLNVRCTSHVNQTA